MRLPSAYVLSHNGLGDNVANIGFIHFLANFYEDVFILCKKFYYHQLSFALQEFPFIHITIIDEHDINDERTLCQNVLLPKYETSDIFISGFNHTPYLKSKITHPYLIDISRLYKDFPRGFKTFLREVYINDNIFLNTANLINKPSVENKSPSEIFYIENVYDYRYQYINVLPDIHYFIDMFYRDNHFNTSICFDFFHVYNDSEIIDLYKQISQYKIIFLHTSSSGTNDVNIVNDFLNPYLDREDVIIICSNHNYYDISHSKYEIANKYIMLPTIFHYTEIIKNAEILIMTNSCISCLTLPLIKRGEIKTNYIFIYDRDQQKLEFPIENIII